MTPKQIRKWYQDNGMEYVPEDWGERSDTGEGQSASKSLPRQHTRDLTPGYFNTAESLWLRRTPEDRKVMEARESFFEPYIAMLPRVKGELVRQLMNDRASIEEMMENRHSVSKGSTFLTLQRALRALVRVIAQDDPDFRLSWPRDHEAERAAAERVFDRYWREVITSA